MLFDPATRGVFTAKPLRGRWFYRRQWPAVYSLKDGLVVGGGYSQGYFKDLHFIPFTAFLESTLPLGIVQRLMMLSDRREGIPLKSMRRKLHLTLDGLVDTIPGVL